ncbi:uncharacterized protein LOC105256831 [Camponotus floridanus]|uniref:uncharacterized protein LOC105256831 n=1 Tax=Camponotus floridanus TaxID=104421 RepID=UPI000DC6BA2A|nr:uncharacterized protein LOC105256831 [Camponotus floridanus]
MKNIRTMTNGHHMIYYEFLAADTYTNDMRKLKLTEQISDIESGKDDIDKKMCRHNREKRRFTSSSEEEDFENEATEEEDSEEKSRTTQEICKKKPSKIPPLPTLSIVKQTQTLPEKKKKIFHNQTSNTDINSSLYNFNKYSTKESSSSVQSDISCTGKQSTSSCKTDFQTEILRKLNIIIHQVKMVDKRLEIHEEQCRFSLDRREDDILQDEEIGLPLHNELALDILETKLKNKEFFESIVYTLKGLGGFDVHSCTINLLKKLITNPLAEMYSMAGAKKKKAFQDLILYKIILKTVRVHYKDTTETEIAQIIAKWLVQAKARRERKKCRYIEENSDLVIIT